MFLSSKVQICWAAGPAAVKNYFLGGGGGRYVLLVWLLFVWSGQMALEVDALCWQDLAAQKDPGPSRSEFL